MANLISAPTSRILKQALIGAVVGGAGTGLFLVLADGTLIHLDDPSVAIAVLAGLIYALIGLFVALGTAAPGAGAKLLNVEDEGELREQRAMLSIGALVCLLIGLFLIELASAPALVTWLGTFGTALLCGATLLLLIGLGVRASSRMDEMNKRISLEANNLALNIVGLLLAGAAIAAAAGRELEVTPLAGLATIAIAQLIAIFWVSGRRGLLTPRTA